MTHQKGTGDPSCLRAGPKGPDRMRSGPFALYGA